MAGQLRHRSTHSRPAAFTIIELLLALAICSGLLVAMVTSIRAMTSTVSANEWYARLTLKGRNVMMRLIDQGRTADAQGPYTTTSSGYTAYLNSGQPMTDVGITFADAGAEGPDSPNPATVYSYLWDQTSKQLLVQKRVNNTLVGSGVMLNGVTNFQVTMWPGKSNAQNTTYDVMLRATFLLQYTDTDPTNKTPQTVTLSGSVVPRKNVWAGHKLAYSIETSLNNNH